MNFKEFSLQVENLTELASGWRGIVYTANFNGTKIAIKVPKREEVMHTTQIEIENVKLLQQFSFVPKLVSSGEDYFAYEFIEGVHLSDSLKAFQKNGDIENYKKVLLQMLSDLFELDAFGMFKKELIRCTKNFIVNEDFQVTMIDFERSRSNIFNKNIPQFLQFLRTRSIFTLEEVIELGSLYSNDVHTVYKTICNRVLSIEIIA